MPGDSDENGFLEEDEDEEDDPLQVTSQELQRLRAEARQQHLAQSLGADPFEEDRPAKFYPLAAPPPLFTAGPPPRRQAPPFTPPTRPRFTSNPTPFNSSGTPVLSGWRSLRLHSHWLIPVTLVAAFFFLVLFTHPQQAGPMIFIFAAIGLIQAAILLYAPNDTFWAVTIVGGLIVFVSVTFFVLFLPIFALILSILLLSLGGVALRERYFPVREGTVAVMGLFGSHNRTLPPGFNLRIPGEKVLGIVETHSIRYDARIPPIILVSGEQVLLTVAVTYQVVPGEEYQAIRLTKDWQRTIQQQLQAVVRDEISMLSIQDFRLSSRVAPTPAPAQRLYDEDEGEEGQEVSPLERINERLTTAMSKKVADRGVAVHEVKVHLMESPHLPGSTSASVPPVLPSQHQQGPVPHPTVALPMMSPPLGPVVEGSVQMPGQDDPRFYPGASLGIGGGQPMPPMYPAGLPVAPPPLRGTVPPADAPSEHMTTQLSPEDLVEAYKAVAERRITDLKTIKRIANQFEAVAAKPELNQHVSFDAAACARNLNNYVQHLQQRSQAQPGQLPNDDDTVTLPGLSEDEEE